MNRKFFFGGMLVLASLFSCSEHHETERETPKLAVTVPYACDTAVFKEYVAQVKSTQHIELRALEKGYLEKIYVDEGQYVREGQLMFQILPRVQQAEFARARSEAQIAELEYLNTQALAQDSVVSQNELAISKAKFEKAKAEQLLAQTHLDFTKIKAPFDGIMGRFHVRLGSLLEEGELLTTLSKNDELWVYFNVPESEYLDLSPKLKQDSSIAFQLKMANGKIFNQSGLLSAIESDFNPETGNIAFRATFKNPGMLLRHGETGNIIMKVPLQNTLLIPQKATYEILDKKYVFVVGEDNNLEARFIEIGAELPHIYAVTRGLSKGERILLEGLHKVHHGERVEPDFVDARLAIEEQLKLYAE